MKRILLSCLLGICTVMAGAQQSLGPVTTPRLNTTFYAGNSTYTSIQKAVTAACATTGARVVVLAGALVSDTIAAANGCTAANVVDERVAPSATYAWQAGAYTLQLPPAGPATLTTLRADTFGGADASIKINACIAAVIAAGGGSCDARALGGAQTLSREIDVNTAAASAAHIQTELIVPAAMTWTLHGFTSATSCGIKVYSSGIITGASEGAGGARANIVTDSSDTSMLAMLCTDNAPAGGGSYIRVSGLALNNAGATAFADGEVNITHLFDESDISYVFAQNYYGDAWHIYQVCCGARFDHIQGITGYGGTSNSGIPLVWGKSGYNTNSMTIQDSTFNRPKTGSPDILITGGAGYTRSLTCLNCYMEGNGDTDSTTPMVDSYGGSIAFIGGMGHTEGPIGSVTTKPVFLNRGESFTVMNFGVVHTLFAVQDTGSGSTKNYWVSPTEGGDPSNPIFSIPYWYGGTYLGGTQYSDNFQPRNILGSPSYLGNLNLSAIAVPTLTTFPTATSGGGLADATTYTYRVTAYNAVGETLPSAELSATTGSTGSNANTVTVEWTHVTGVTGYKLYGRTAGSETLLTTLVGDSNLYWIDVGATATATALPTADTTIPCLFFAYGGQNYFCQNITTSGTWQLTNLHSGIPAFSTYGGSAATTNVNSDNGTGPVQINNLIHAGTGGLEVWSGGSSAPILFGKINASGYAGAAILTSASIQNTYPTLNWLLPGASTSNPAWQDTGYSGSRGITDFANSLLRFQLATNGPAYLNSGAGSSGIQLNSTVGSGTGGLRVYGGGATPAQVSQLDGLGGLYLGIGNSVNFHIFGTPTAYRNLNLQDAGGWFALLSNLGCSGSTGPSGTSSSTTYLRGDCSWASPPLSPVSSVFGQTGAVPDLSGDVTTSGSSATVVGRVNGAALPTSAAYVGTDGVGHIVAASAPSGAVTSVFGQTGAVPNLSGDVTTSGSSATVVGRVNGAALPTSAAYVGTDGVGHIVAASAPSGAVASVFGQTGAVPNLSGDVTTSGSSAASVKKINGQPITNIPVMVWSPYLACALQYGCSDTSIVNLIYPVILQAWTLFVNTQAQGCTTPGVFGIYNGATQIGSLTVPNTTAQISGTLTTPAVAASSALLIKVATSAAGCTTYPSGYSTSVTYTMQ